MNENVDFVVYINAEEIIAKGDDNPPRKIDPGLLVVIYKNFGVPSLSVPDINVVPGNDTVELLTANQAEVRLYDYGQPVSKGLEVLGGLIFTTAGSTALISASDETNGQGSLRLTAGASHHKTLSENEIVQ